MTNVNLQIVSFSGLSEPCEINFEPGSPVDIRVETQCLGTAIFTDNDLFGALSKLRLRLEQKGYLLLCNAARRDAYPSRMVREMGGGRKIYLLTPGLQTRRDDLVDVFGAASFDQVGTLEEQLAFHENWIRSLK